MPDDLCEISIGGWGGLNASEPQPGSEPCDWREVGCRHGDAHQNYEDAAIVTSGLAVMAIMALAIMAVMPS